MESNYQTNRNYKQVGTTSLSSDKADIKPKLINRNKDGHSLLIKVTIYEEIVIIVSSFPLCTFLTNGIGKDLQDDGDDHDSGPPCTAHLCCNTFHSLQRCKISKGSLLNVLYHRQEVFLCSCLAENYLLWMDVNFCQMHFHEIFPFLKRNTSWIKILERLKWKNKNKNQEWLWFQTARDMQYIVSHPLICGLIFCIS